MSQMCWCKCNYSTFYILKAVPKPRILTPKRYMLYEHPLPLLWKHVIFKHNETLFPGGGTGKSGLFPLHKLRPLCSQLRVLQELIHLYPRRITCVFAASFICVSSFTISPLINASLAYLLGGTLDTENGLPSSLDPNKMTSQDQRQRKKSCVFSVPVTSWLGDLKGTNFAAKTQNFWTLYLRGFLSYYLKTWQKYVFHHVLSDNRKTDFVSYAL